MSNRFLTLDNGAFKSMPFSPRYQAIENFTAAGIPLYPAGAGSIPTIGTPAAVRNAIGLGTLATQSSIPSLLVGITDNSVPAVGSADVIDDAFFAASPVTVTTAGTVTLFPVENLFFNEELYTEFSTDATIEIPVNVTFDQGYYLIHGHTGFANYYRPSSVKIELFSPVFNQWLVSLPETSWPADGGNLLFAPSDTNIGYAYNKARITLKGTNYRLTKIRWVLTKSNTNPVLYKKDTRLQSVAGPFGAASFIANSSTEATSTTTGSLRTDGIGIGGGAIAVGKRVQFTPVSAASQPNLSLFVDSGTGKLSFKDSTGTVNSLY
jgi:hypothetical protein